MLFWNRRKTCHSPDAAPVVDETYEVQPRSLVLLFAGRLPAIGRALATMTTTSKEAQRLMSCIPK